MKSDAPAVRRARLAAPALRCYSSTRWLPVARLLLRQPQPASGGLDPAELEKFLINFVVEQTGYPPEVVELDADLEADLGIDSIKKAQLFGELAEYFDVQADRRPVARRLPDAASRGELPGQRGHEEGRSGGRGHAGRGGPLRHRSRRLPSAAALSRPLRRLCRSASCSRPAAGLDPAELE